MSGLLQEKKEIEKLQKEFEDLTSGHFNTEKTINTIIISKEEEIAETCEV